MTINSAVIDVGGSSVKVTIRNQNSETIESHVVSITSVVQGKHIYINPETLFSIVMETMNKCMEKFVDGVKVDKIYISSLRQGFCLIADSKEITPLYLNSDTSGDSAKLDIESYGSAKIYDETGHWFAPQLTLPKLINLFRQKPEWIGKKFKLLFIHDWLVWRLTNQLVTEMTLVSAGQMAMISEKKIHTVMLEHFNISPDIFPNLSDFRDEVSELNKHCLDNLNKGWGSAVVHVGGGDSHFLHLGASGNKFGTIVVSAGSSTPISLLSQTLGHSRILHPWKSTSFSPDMYFLEGNLGYPGSFHGWLKKNISTQISSYAIDVTSISRAPTVFGACNMWNEEKWESRPAFSILGDFSGCSSNDLALGLALDYAYALSNQISHLIADLFEVNEIVLTGGGANIELYKILKSLLTVPIRLISTNTAVNNLFSLLEYGDDAQVDLGIEVENLDLGTSQFLREQATNHAVLYSQAEGTRKVLENAK